MITANNFFTTPLYLTTPIFYPSGAPTLGHVYTLAVADALARAHRLGDEKTFLLTGTDEHGQKIAKTAAAHGVSPQQWVDNLVESQWRPLLDLLDVSNDDFIRTTDAKHEQVVQRVLVRLKESGHIYLASRPALYCVECEEVKTLSDLSVGPAGEQLCAVHLIPAGEIADENYFFRLSAFQDELLTLLEAQPDFIQPTSARNEVINFIRSGLEDLSISRTNIDWGVKVPWDERHVVYVWFDALLNYLSGTGWDGIGPVPYIAPPTHLIGKDILRFHAVIWPAVLLALGLPLPKQVLSHGWLVKDGRKVAKSAGNSISPAQAVELCGLDPLRYYLLRNITLGSDGAFGEEELRSIYSAFFSNSYGNLVSRLSKLLIQHCGGIVPALGQVAEEDARLLALVEQRLDLVRSSSAFDVLRNLSEAAEAIIAATNAYLSEQQPWKLAKDIAQIQRVNTILSVSTQALLTATVLLGPLIPQSAQKVWQVFGQQELHGSVDEQQLRLVDHAGGVTRQVAALFPRLK